MFKELPTHISSYQKKIPKKKSKNKRINKADKQPLDQINTYLTNRKLLRMKISGPKVILYLVDGRKIIANTEKNTIKVSLRGSIMTVNELEDFNYQVKKAWENVKKTMPTECRSCVADLEFP